MYYGKKTDPFYKSKKWRRARAQALERDHYICQDCMAAKRRGAKIRPRSATVVHHIKSVEERPDLKLELDNLISLCAECHNKRHPEKGGWQAEAAAAPPAAGVRIIKV